jgi:formate dehydrogenase iron-sulfur subunit
MAAAMDPLAIRRISAMPTPEPSIRAKTVPKIAKLVDVSLCIGCKACEVACKQWNDLGVDDTHNFGSIQSHPELTPNTWDLMVFNEVEVNGALQWLIRKDSCLHCEEPGCLFACPSPGAIVQYANGIVDFDQEQCIGCRQCMTGCPFNIPKYDPESQKVYKCTLCVDRVGAGGEPACAKACPTSAIKFGAKDDLLGVARESIGRLKARGFAHAALYDPPGVGGTHMMYVLPHGDHVSDYGLPVDPTPRRAGLGLLGPWTWGSAGLLWTGFLGLVVHFLRFRSGRLDEIRARERELNEGGAER